MLSFQPRKILVSFQRTRKIRQFYYLLPVALLGTCSTNQVASFCILTTNARQVMVNKASQDQSFSVEKGSLQVDDAQVKPIAGTTVPLGGDFAGLFATFDISGQLIAVPEQYVPEALLEWGQAPPALEVLVSEDEISTTKAISRNDKSKQEHWQRQELTILPETGCGVDNLEVLKRSEDIPVTSIQYYKKDESAVLARTLTFPLNPNHSQRERIRVESTFPLDLAAAMRSRISVDIQLAGDTELPDFRIQTPVRVYWERQISLSSSHGSRADGGGLDGRSVSEWIGPVLRQFEKQLERLNGNGSQMKWINTNSDASSLLDGPTIMLPGNVTVFCGPAPTNDDEWKLQVGQIDSSGTSRYVVEHTWAKNAKDKQPTRIWKESGQLKSKI